MISLTINISLLVPNLVRNAYNSYKCDALIRKVTKGCQLSATYQVSHHSLQKSILFEVNLLLSVFFVGMIFRKNHKVTCSLYSHIFLPNFSWNLPHTRALLLLFLLLIGDQQIYRPVLTEPVLRNIESLYESCCSLGKTAAYTIGLNGPDNSVGEETCASVLQLEISAPLQVRKSAFHYIQKLSFKGNFAQPDALLKSFESNRRQ